MADEIFKIETSESNILKLYRTPTKMTSSTHNCSISVINNIPYVLVPGSFSYTIYNLQDLTLQFISTPFEKIDRIIHSGVFVYILSRGIIFKTYRGEVCDTYKLEFCCDEIIDFLKFGSHFLVCSKREIHLFYCRDMEVETDIINEDSADENNLNNTKSYEKECFIIKSNIFKYQSDITKIFHPMAYLNKILIVFDDGKCDLFNLNSEKTIFSYNFSKPIKGIAQTSVVDVVGLIHQDNTIGVYNLKKNKVIFTINEYKNNEVKEINFKDNHMLVGCGTGIVSIYDLEMKKEIFQKDGLSGLLINSEMAFLVTKNSIELFTLNDMKILKSRCILNSGVKSIKAYSDADILLISENALFKMNIYRDEMSMFLKTPFKPIKFVSYNTNGNILITSGSLSYIKKGKWHKFVNLNPIFSKIFLDFAMIVMKLEAGYSILIMNIQSKRVILKFKADEFVSGDFDNENITILTKSFILLYNYNGKETNRHYFLESERLENFSVIISEKATIEKIGNIFFIKDTYIYVYTDKLIRRFVGNSFSLDTSIKIMATVNDKYIYLFDLISGNILDRILTNKDLIDVAIVNHSGTFKYLLVLDNASDVHLLSNLSHFNSIKNEITSVQLIKQNFSQITIKKETSFYRDLMIFKDIQGLTEHLIDSDLTIKALDKHQVNEILIFIKRGLIEDFYGTQNVLNKLLLYKSRFIPSEDLIYIQKLVNDYLIKYEEKVLKTKSYLQWQRRRLI